MIGSFLIYSLSPWLVLAALGLALGCPWLDLGAHLAQFELPLGALGAPWAPFGVPWGFLGGPLGVPGGPLGCPGRFSQICRKLDAQFRANVSILQCLRIKNGLAEFIPGSPGSRLSAQSGARAAVPNPTSRAGGQDDVSLEQTPSNYLMSIMDIVYVYVIAH